jgi:hypothetical protein
MKQLYSFLLVILLLTVIVIGSLVRPEFSDFYVYWLSVLWTCLLIAVFWFVLRFYLFRQNFVAQDNVIIGEASGVTPSIVFFVGIYCLVSFVLLWVGLISTKFTELPIWHWVGQSISLGVVSLMGVSSLLASGFANASGPKNLASKEVLLKKIKLFKLSAAIDEPEILDQLKELESIIKYFMPHISRISNPEDFERLSLSILSVTPDLAKEAQIALLRQALPDWIANARSCC